LKQETDNNVKYEQVETFMRAIWFYNVNFMEGSTTIVLKSC